MMTTGHDVLLTQYEPIARHTECLHQAEVYRAAYASGSVHPLERILERIGTSFIGFGRWLCERQGSVVVDVTFHPAGQRNRRHAA